MAILVGQEAEGAEVETSAAIEIGVAFKFTASATGKVTALHMKFSANGTGTKARIALQADEAGKPKEGVLVEGELTSVASGAHEVAVAETEVKAGTVYWLTVLALGGNAKYKPGSTTPKRSSTEKHLTIAAITAANWGPEGNKGPVSIWATGTEGSVVQGKASGAMLLTGTAKGTTAAVVSGKATGVLLLGGTAKGTAAQRVEGKASGALLLTGTATGATRSVVAGKAAGSLLLTGAAKGTTAGGVAGKASGAILLTGT